MSDKKVYAVTGGIGSGKSTVMEYISSLGYKTISCDEEINNLYKEESVKKVLADIFPTAVRDDVIDRKEIARIIFNDKEKLTELENYIHPLVMERCIKLARENNQQKIAFIEVPLLFESNLESLFDGVIIVVRDKKERIESVKMRSNLTENEIIDRIKNQVDYDVLNLENYEIIVNNGEMENLKEKIIEKIQKILR